jgi:hypothetical protein
LLSVVATTSDASAIGSLDCGGLFTPIQPSFGLWILPLKVMVGLLGTASFDAQAA